MIKADLLIITEKSAKITSPGNTVRFLGGYIKKLEKNENLQKILCRVIRECPRLSCPDKKKSR